MNDLVPPEASLSWTTFSMIRAAVDSDGTIRIPAGGYSPSQGVWDGFIEIRPGHPEHPFWSWLVEGSALRDQLSDADLPALKAEYQTVQQASAKKSEPDHSLNPRCTGSMDS